MFELPDPTQLGATPSLAEVRWFSKIVLRMHSCAREADLHTILASAIHVHMRSGVTSAEEVTYDLSSHTFHQVSGWVRPPPWYMAAVVDSPLVVTLFRDRVVGTLHSALVPKSELHRSNFYNLLVRPENIDHQLLGIARTSPHGVNGIGVNRDTPFSENECLLFSLLRDHFEACLLRLRRIQRSHALTPLRDPSLWLDGTLRPARMTSAQMTLLRSYFPHSTTRLLARQLPEEVERWARRSLARLSGTDFPAPLTALKVEAARGCLLLRLFPSADNDSVLLRMMEDPRLHTVSAFRAHGLSTRECEVVHWLMEGKRDKEIALLLGIAPRTASKHVERLCQKFGVGNRVGVSAAAAALLRGNGS